MTGHHCAQFTIHLKLVNTAQYKPKTAQKEIARLMVKLDKIEEGKLLTTARSLDEFKFMMRTTLEGKSLTKTVIHVIEDIGGWFGSKDDEPTETMVQYYLRKKNERGKSSSFAWLGLFWPFGNPFKPLAHGWKVTVVGFEKLFIKMLDKPKNH